MNDADPFWMYDISIKAGNALRRINELKKKHGIR